MLYPKNYKTQKNNLPQLRAEIEALRPIVRKAFPLMAEPQWLCEFDNARVRRLNRELKSQGMAALQLTTNEAYRRFHPEK